VIDSRHGFLLGNAVADLQKGERYVNTDLAFLSATRHRQISLAKTSYDIACQYSVNFWKRSSAFPSDYVKHLDTMEIEFGIPKFHLPAHGPKCHSVYSLNFMNGWARTDGEGIERTWANTNPLATSTREMAGGARHDFLDDQFGAQNFKKLVGLGTSLAS
jgi:hypothetical protein